MAVAQEQIGKSKAIANHDHDMIHELSKLLDAVWRYDQYIANAEDKPKLQKFWKDQKENDQKQVERLKELIKEHISDGCF